MEASVKEATPRSERKLDSEKARRIVAAMRASVARHGVAKATFDAVAQEAGVSRGLLHYYFGSKERLLVEVVRHDSDVRIHALEEHLAGAHSAEEIVQALLDQLEWFLHSDPAEQALLYEMVSISRRSAEVRTELAALYARWRTTVGALLREKQSAGEIELRGEPDAVASVLFALGDGLIMQLLADPEYDRKPAIESGVRVARFLLGGDA